MTPSSRNLAALAVAGAIGLAQAATTITIDAVDTAFEPNTATAEVGDVVEFVFKPSNHSVVRGSLDKACEPLEEDGFFSGFIPVTEGEPVRLLVRSYMYTCRLDVLPLILESTAKHLPRQDHRHQAHLLLLLAGQALPRGHVRRHQPREPRRSGEVQNGCSGSKGEQEPIGWSDGRRDHRAWGGR